MARIDEGGDCEQGGDFELIRSYGELLSEIGIAIGLAGWGGGTYYYEHICSSCLGLNSPLSFALGGGFLCFAISFFALVYTLSQRRRTIKGGPAS